MRKLSNLHVEYIIELSDVKTIQIDDESDKRYNHVIVKIKHRKENLDVIWYNVSDRSSFCSKYCCMVAKPIRRGSRSPTRQFLISIPFFCLGLASVGLASNNRSFKAPTRTACKKVYHHNIKRLKAQSPKHKQRTNKGLASQQPETPQKTTLTSEVNSQRTTKGVAASNTTTSNLKYLK